MINAELIGKAGRCNTLFINQWIKLPYQRETQCMQYH
jgi:hypothetical protein